MDAYMLPEKKPDAPSNEKVPDASASSSPSDLEDNNPSYDHVDLTDLLSERKLLLKLDIHILLPPLPPLPNLLRRLLQPRQRSHRRPAETPTYPAEKQWLQSRAFLPHNPVCAV